MKLLPTFVYSTPKEFLRSALYINQMEKSEPLIFEKSFAIGFKQNLATVKTIPERWCNGNHWPMLVSHAMDCMVVGLLHHVAFLSLYFKDIYIAPF